MLRGEDERAVTVQIGAILLLAIVFSALALYQVNAVPDQNRGVEFDHSDRVEGDLLELRDSIRNTGTAGTTQGVPIELGTQYESRVAAVNPPHPAGTLRTVEPASNVTIDYGDSAGSDTFETRHLVYEPHYNEYDAAPRTVVEHSFVYNRFDGAEVAVGDQQLISDSSDRITLLLLDGELHERASGTASVSVESLDPMRTTTLESGSAITLPTESPERWEAELEDVDGASYDESASGDGVVTITLEERFDLDIARVGVGGGASAMGDAFDVGEPRGDGSDGDGSSGAYDVSFDTEVENAAECTDEERCDYSVTTGASPRFSASADAASASFDFAYAADDGVTVENFDEDGATGEVAFDVSGSGEIALFVSSGGSSDSITIEVRDGVIVTDVEPRDPVEAGTDLDVDITVENRHDVESTQTVALSVDSERDGEFVEVDSSEETIAAGATATVTLTYATEDGDAPEIDVRGTTDEDTDGVVRAAEVFELDGMFDVRITGTNAPVAEGETLEVTTAVSQTVGATLSLEVDGEVVDQTTVDEDGAVTLEWETEEGDAGDRTVTVVSQGLFTTKSDERDVTITAAGGPSFEVANSTITGEKTSGQAGVDEVTFEYRIDAGTDVEFTVFDEAGNPVGESVSAESDGSLTEVAVDVTDGSTSPGREPRPIELEASVVDGETCSYVVESGDGDGPFDLCG